MQTPQRTPQQVLRSLAISVTCTGLWLDTQASRPSFGTDALTTFQLPHLLGALGKAEQWSAADFDGLVSPGVGESTLELLTCTVLTPESPDALCAGLAAPHPYAALRPLMTAVGAQVAAGRRVNGGQLMLVCEALAQRVTDLLTGQPR